MSYDLWCTWMSKRCALSPESNYLTPFWTQIPAALRICLQNTLTTALCHVFHPSPSLQNFAKIVTPIVHAPRPKCALERHMGEGLGNLLLDDIFDLSQKILDTQNRL